MVCKVSKDFNFFHFLAFFLLITKKASSAARDVEEKKQGQSECFFSMQLTSLKLLQSSIQAITLKNPPTEQTA